MRNFVENLTNENVTLTAYLLDRSKEMKYHDMRPAVVVLPGGGYRYCSDREAEPIAMAFLAQGYHAFVLRYSLNENSQFPRPLNDAQEALKMIRDNSEDWGVIPDKIAVCGFSAGGHLAAAVSTMGEIRPNATILCYPGILSSISPLVPFEIPSVDEEVDELTPPTYIFATANDGLVPIENSLKYALALDKYKIPFEVHIFQDGPHGVALANDVTCMPGSNKLSQNVAKWVDLCVGWLKSIFRE